MSSQPTSVNKITLEYREYGKNQSKLVAIHEQAGEVELSEYDFILTQQLSQLADGLIFNEVDAEMFNAIRDAN